MTLKENAEKRHQHARGCKVKGLDDCAACKANIAWFASLSLADLNTVLSEAPPIRRDR